MGSSENISLSGMRAAERRLETSAHNTANASTDGFGRQQVESREKAGVETHSDTVELTDEAKELAAQIDGPQNNVDQASEAIDRISASAQFAGNARVLSIKDRLIRSLLDIFG
jgi:flagellar hook-associated protein FlgK